MASDSKTNKNSDKAPAASAKDSPVAAPNDKLGKASPAPTAELPKDDAAKADPSKDATTKPADPALPDTDDKEQDKSDKGDELRPGALTAASAGAPGLLPGEEVNPDKAPHNAPLTGIKDGGQIVSTVNESGTTDGIKRVVKEDREPLTGVNPVSGLPHDGAAPNLRDASMGFFDGDQPNRSSDELADPAKFDALGGRSGFDAAKDTADKVRQWYKSADDKLGDLKTNAKSFLDSFDGLFKSDADSASK